MKRVVGVKFRDSGKVYYFDPLDLTIEKDDSVIVETARGIVFGDVAETPRMVVDEQVVSPLKPVIRVATPEDIKQRDIYIKKEEQAFATAQKMIEEHNLPMKLVDAEYAFNGTKLTLYFTADSRVDFRDLLKDLAGIFRTRIELRQIGVRDEA